MTSIFYDRKKIRKVTRQGSKRPKIADKYALLHLNCIYVGYGKLTQKIHYYMYIEAHAQFGTADRAETTDLTSERD
jgi:hypothetical protein